MGRPSIKPPPWAACQPPNIQLAAGTEICKLPGAATKLACQPDLNGSGVDPVGDKACLGTVESLPWDPPLTFRASSTVGAARWYVTASRQACRQNLTLTAMPYRFSYDAPPFRLGSVS